MIEGKREWRRKGRQADKKMKADRQLHTRPTLFEEANARISKLLED